VLFINYFKRRHELKDTKNAFKNLRPNESEKLIEYLDIISEHRDNWAKRSKYYHDEILKILQFLIPSRASILEIGCGTGDLLYGLSRNKVKGIDISPGMIKKATQKYPQIPFEVMDAETLDPTRIDDRFDYIIMSDLIGYLTDVQKAFEECNKIMHDDSRIVINSYNYLWEPLLRWLEQLHLKMPQYRQNWLSMYDISNLAELSNMEVVKKGTAFLCPLKIPLFSWIFNKYLVRLPLIRHFGLIQYFVLKQMDLEPHEYSVSVVIPARNESGNIEQAILRTPEIGKYMEFVFVEGHSTDDTWQEINRVYEKYKETHRIKIMQQQGVGKGDAVRKGFQEASGEIVTILDADLTVSPEELPKFYNVISRRQADFANGCRLVYPIEKKAMRFLNVRGNKIFSILFTWLLDQPIKDTLCGTKMLLKSHYEKIAENRNYFGDFDPFGDYDLLFGASKLNLKIIEVPIRYKARTYGTTNIQRWSHGLLLVRMVFFALRKIKFF
jgi:SAM-dependent methyltransferase